ncbi:hypothetical protein K505DRAFT_29131 [Melanomma pulvis-pyrius CBS 109.77]|uniref:Uncharacterized protein n=1 Tax=Melanomma pulvis-pyrius CBS 109.77 TaxID=1314802 RepID=A0A6A6XWC7_9PLEO|nr:hypothetical protein K505DRAFT_29131 [Melanomma pulvis-pyrius CBS 109.77]
MRIFHGFLLSHDSSYSTVRLHFFSIIPVVCYSSIMVIGPGFTGVGIACLSLQARVVSSLDLKGLFITKVSLSVCQVGTRVCASHYTLLIVIFACLTHIIFSRFPRCHFYQYDNNFTSSPPNALVVKSLLFTLSINPPPSAF